MQTFSLGDKTLRKFIVEKREGGKTRVVSRLPGRSARSASVGIDRQDDADLGAHRRPSSPPSTGPVGGDSAETQMQCSCGSSKSHRFAKYRGSVGDVRIK